MIANSPKARKVYDPFLLGRLAGWVYPHASGARLYVLADWMSAYFVLDDVLDDTLEAPHDGQRVTGQCRSTPARAKPQAHRAHRVEPAGSRDRPPRIRHRAPPAATGPAHPASPLHPAHRRPESGQL